MSTDPKYDTYVLPEESKKLRNEELSKRADIHHGLDKRIGKSTDKIGWPTHDARMKRMYRKVQRFGRATAFGVQEGPFMRLGVRIDTLIYRVLNYVRDTTIRALEKFGPTDRGEP